MGELHVALIDDDEYIRAPIGEFLSERGHSVGLFDSGEAFFASPTSRDFDCLVVDVYMPGMSGLEVARLLRNWGIDCPIIFITGSHDLGIDEAAEALGARCVLRKPFEPGALIECVEGGHAQE
jgi:FixJ family two-component response regulator